MEIENRLYKSDEVAKLLQVTRRTVYRYVELGQIKPLLRPSTRSPKGAPLYFTPEEIRRFLGLTEDRTEVISSKQDAKKENNQS